MNPDSITSWLRKFSERHNLLHIHPHAFRHIAASTMIANGVDLVTAASELGHANATTTANIYAHQITIAKVRAAKVRGSVFSPREQPAKRRKKHKKLRVPKAGILNFCNVLANRPPFMEISQKLPLKSSKIRGNPKINPKPFQGQEKWSKS